MLGPIYIAPGIYYAEEPWDHPKRGEQAVGWYHDTEDDDYRGPYSTRAAAQKALDEYTHELFEPSSLKELRESMELAQGEVARRIGVSQSQISILESRPDRVRIESIKRYIEALGGRLDLIAVFEDERVALKIF